MFSEVHKLFKSVIDEEIISVCLLPSAYTNKVYKVFTTQNKYVLKVYSDKNTVNHNLSRVKVYYKDYTFCIEEYIMHRECNNDIDYLLVAEELRKLHNTYKNLKLTDNSVDIAEMSNKISDHIPNLNSLKNRIYEIYLAKLKDLGYEEEYNILNDTLQRIETQMTKWKSKVLNISPSNKLINKVVSLLTSYTICHNDLQPGNILICDGKALCIDFENASVNSPLCDISNYFIETSMDYKISKIDPKKGLTKVKKEEFLKKYLDLKEKEDFIYPLFDEIFIGIGIAENYSHLMWYIWSILFERVSLTFDYTTYRNDRVNRLYLNKCSTEKERNILIKK